MKKDNYVLVNSDITIECSSVTFGGNLVSHTKDSKKDVTITGDCVFKGNVVLNSSVSVAKDIVFNSNAVLNSNISAKNDIVFNSDAVLNSSVSAEKDIHFNGGADSVKIGWWTALSSESGSIYFGSKTSPVKVNLSNSSGTLIVYS